MTTDARTHRNDGNAREQNDEKEQQQHEIKQRQQNLKLKQGWKGGGGVMERALRLDRHSLYFARIFGVVVQNEGGLLGFLFGIRVSLLVG